MLEFLGCGLSSEISDGVRFFGLICGAIYCTDHSIVSGFLDFIDHFPLNILLNKAGISISTSNYTILYI